MIDESLDPDTPLVNNNTQSWSRDEIAGLVTGIAILAVLALSTIALGLVGLLIPSLVAVVVIFALLIMVSFG